MLVEGLTNLQAGGLACCGERHGIVGSAGPRAVVQCACTALVALGAAIWPLIVDGLSTMATVELSRAPPDAPSCRGGR